MGARVGLLCLGLLAVGCGYRFTAGPGALPEGVRRVCAPLFRNATPEPDLEVWVTQAVRRRLSERGVHGAGGCDAELQGELLSVSTAPTVVRPSVEGRLASYRVSIRARIRLVGGGRTLVDATVGSEEDHLPAADGDVLTTEANREAALLRGAEALAREIEERLTQGT